LKLRGELQTKYNMYDKESNNEDASAEVNNKDPPLLKYDNYFRHEIPNCISDYTLNLLLILSSDIAVSRLYSNLKRTHSCDPIQYNVCMQYKIHLISDDYNEAI